MPAKVKENCPPYKVPKLDEDDPAINSGDTARDVRGWRKLSFLEGATVGGGTNDMGCEDYYSYDSDTWRARANLRRHTVDQGMSTWSWPRKP